MNENKKFSISNMMLAFITVLVVIGLVALAGFFLLTPPDDIIMGQAEATQVRISGKVPGRIASYRFGRRRSGKAEVLWSFRYARGYGEAETSGGGSCGSGGAER